MSDEPDRPDAYYEVQVDRETLVLLALGLLVLLVAAFLIGRWSASGAAPPDEPIAVEDGSSRSDPGDPGATELVDGDPPFGASPLSVEGAPPIGAVPVDPVPEPDPGPTRAAGAQPRPEPRPESTTRPGSTAPSEPPAAPAAKPSSGNPGWVVQVAAVRSSADAGALRKRLEGKGFPVRVVREAGLSKVQVGPFGRRQDAEAAERRLKREERLSTWVKRP